MYFYDSLLLICNILILTTHTQSQNATGPGIAACVYLGTTMEKCNVPNINLTAIPAECTSIFFNELQVDLNYHVSGGCDIVDMNFDTLDKVLNFSKPKYVYYGHSSQQEWTRVLFCEADNNGVNSLDEMKGLIAFMGEHPGINGLILTGLEFDDNSIEFPGYSENLKTYLDVMKNSIPGIEIGIEISGSFLIDQILYPTIPWLDIKVIDPFLDLYVIAALWMNDCGEDFRQGITPISSAITNYTLENLKGVIQQAGIPKEKTYFQFRLNPVSEDSSLTRCYLTLQEVCSNSTDTSTWCYDRQSSFNEKGKFVKENGVGFVTTSIDLNDPDNTCGCPSPYVSFYAILDGFNGATSQPCSIYSAK